MNDNLTVSPSSFAFNGNLYTLNASACTFYVKINGKDISKYLKSGTSVGWYDVSKSSGRDVTNANGKMIYNVVSTKYRLDLVCRHLDNDEMVDFYSEIIKSPIMSVEFYNPFTGQTQTLSEAYRGDRSAKPYMPYGAGVLFEGPTQALIEM